MRTTLTLDEDVARLLSRESRRAGTSFKETVNHFLRLGLTMTRQNKRKAFVVAPRRLGLPAGMTYDNVEQLIESLEGASHR
ncbi:MAG: hypothetical protein ACRD3L_05110 [Terriglobales bacterium]